MPKNDIYIALTFKLNAKWITEDETQQQQQPKLPIMIKWKAIIDKIKATTTTIMKWCAFIPVAAMQQLERSKRLEVHWSNP